MKHKLKIKEEVLNRDVRDRKFSKTQDQDPRPRLHPKTKTWPQDSRPKIIKTRDNF